MVMKIAFCDDLGAPELGIVMDVDWYKSVRQELEQWLLERGCGTRTPHLLLMNEEVKMEFMLTWA
jgi:hypothetical protein